MKSEDFVKQFRKLINMNPQGLMGYLNQQLNENYKYSETIIENDFYLYAPGDIPVMLVAHLDTVFPESSKELYFDPVKEVLWSPDGAGFDDRAGVLGILTILSFGLKPHILFTMGEEKGGKGAQRAVSTLKLRNKFKYIIELDRRGRNDCVFYDCGNHKFIKYVQTFGFDFATGSFSDISFLGPVWDIACVNLSIGYEDEHTYAEHLFLSNFKRTIVNVIKMLRDIDSAKYYKFMGPKKKKENKVIYHCDCCGMSFGASEVVQVKDLGIFCMPCYNNYIRFDWEEDYGKVY